MNKELYNLLELGVSEVYKRLCPLQFCKEDELCEMFSKFYDRVSVFNPIYKLVAGTDREIVIKHFFDCFAAVPIIQKYVGNCGTMADLGSGAGFPGIVLASVFNRHNITLVERMGRRAGFLRNTVAYLGLKNVTVMERNLEEINEHFDFISFRAFRPLKDIALDLSRITKKNAVIFAFKSTEDNINTEISDLEKISSGVFSTEVVPYDVPFLDARRALLILKKNS